MAGKIIPVTGDTVPLLRRLWGEHVAHHRRSLVLIMLPIVIGGAATSLYPLLIREAFDALDRREIGGCSTGGAAGGDRGNLPS